MGRSSERAKWSWLLAAAGVLVIAAWWLSRPTQGAGHGGLALRPPPAADESRAEPPELPRAAAPIDLAAPVASGAAGGAAPNAPAARAVLRGTVTRASDGRPAPGVPVFAVVAIDGQVTRPPLDEAASQAVTDAEGRYRLVYSARCTLRELRARPGPETVRARRDADLPLELGAGQTLDLVVGRGAALAGRVVDTTGRPVPGATVTAHADTTTQNYEQVYEPDRRVVADGAGEFVLEGLASSFVIVALAPGFAVCEQLVGQMEEGERLGLTAGGAPVDPPLTVVLAPERAIRGVVLGADGNPVYNAHVFCTPSELSPEERRTAAPRIFHEAQGFGDRRTRADGRFEIAPVGAEVCEIDVLTEGFKTWGGRHARGDPDLLVQLDVGVVLTGTVTVRATGAPVVLADVFVDFPTADEYGTEMRGDATDAAGRFAVAGLEPAEGAVVGVVAEGFASVAVPRVPLAAAGPNVLDVQLDPERVLAGVVVDSEGSPVGGAALALRSDRTVHIPMVGGDVTRTWESFFDLNPASADGEGRFRFRGLYDGTFTVSAAHPSDERLTARVEARSGREDLRLVLAPGSVGGVTLIGVATDALTGVPVTSFDVEVFSTDIAGGAQQKRHFESADGSYRIEGLPPGETGLTARAPRCALLTPPPISATEGEVRLDLHFTAARAAAFRVLDAERRPVPAELDFRTADGDLLMVETGVDSWRSNLRTDEHGEARVNDLPALPIVVKVTADGREGPQDFPLDLRAEPLGPIELVVH
jgi:hypothetical protein